MTIPVLGFLQNDEQHGRGLSPALMNTRNETLKFFFFGTRFLPPKKTQADRLAFQEKKTTQEASNDVGGEIPFMEVDGDGDEDDNRSRASSGGTRRGEDDQEGPMSGVEDEINDENARLIRPRARSPEEACFSQLTARISKRGSPTNSSWKELSLSNNGKVPGDVDSQGAHSVTKVILP